MSIPGEWYCQPRKELAHITDEDLLGETVRRGLMPPEIVSAAKDGEPLYTVDGAGAAFGNDHNETYSGPCSEDGLDCRIDYDELANACADLKSGFRDDGLIHLERALDSMFNGDFVGRITTL